MIIVIIQLLLYTSCIIGRQCACMHAHAAVFPRKPWLIIRMLSRVCPLSLKSIVNVHMYTILQL
eukprot:SAG22_NODE_1183_length_5231_cov_6.467069_3_plen_64_part_00